MAEVTVLYDEGCRFCTTLAEWLDGFTGIAIAPIGSATGDLLLRDLSPGERYASVHVVDPLGRRRSAGAALPPLLRRLPAGRPVAALAEALPFPAERAYRLVAGNRALLSRVVASRQSTESRSTTKTSGSCGAITPPAPRAP